MFKPAAAAAAAGRRRSFNPSVGILGVQARRTGVLSRHVGLGFNPSVGILGVQAAARCCDPTRCQLFQSLGRDSGCSSVLSARCGLGCMFVSIPRSGFWVFKHTIVPFHSLSTLVSIPRSGFWVFKLRALLCTAASSLWFQSLGRDSGCSSVDCLRLEGRRCLVSIPRSGFWVFKLPELTRAILGFEIVSIPRSGFWVFKPPTSTRGGRVR